jgi:hypothetical protein
LGPVDLCYRFGYQTVELLLHLRLQGFPLSPGHGEITYLMVYHGGDLITPRINRKQAEGYIIRHTVIFLDLLLLTGEFVQPVTEISLTAKEDI